MLVEGIEPFLDSFNIVVDASRWLTTLQQTLSHCFVTDFKVENLWAGTDFLFKFLALRYFTGISELVEYACKFSNLEFVSGEKIVFLRHFTYKKKIK